MRVMSIAKAILLGVWLASFGTLAYLYLALYRKLPSNTGVSTSVFEAYMTHNVFWWLGIAACFGIAFMIVRAWPGRPILWVALALTELFPMPRPLRRSIHRVSRSLPRLNTAFQHLDVRKALRLVFRCLTDSARFGGSRSIKNDLLRLW